MDRFRLTFWVGGIFTLGLFLSGCAHAPEKDGAKIASPDGSSSYALPGGQQGLARAWANRVSRSFQPVEALVEEPHGFQHLTFLAPASQAANDQYTIILRNLSEKENIRPSLTFASYGSARRNSPSRPGTLRKIPIHTLSFFPGKSASSFNLRANRFRTRRYALGGFDYERTFGAGRPEDGEVESDFPVICNDDVKEFICYFQDKENFMRHSLARGEQYLPMMKSIFRENDLPEDLAYLSLIESGFNPHAFSRAGASGPWQFMKGTARRYGLEMNQYVDERKDPEKSTRAAARYLKDLYSMFGDWYLAVTAYNAGEGNVAEAIKKHNTTDFWELQKITHLKAESREFVPKLLAAITIGKQPEEYGFDELELRAPHLTRVRIPKPTNLKFLADMAEVSLGELRACNPELRNSCTPPSKNGYWIKIPVGRKEAFERNFAKNKDKAPASAGSFCEHRIKRGETLSHIARQYRTDTKTLQKINGIKNPRTLSPGRVLRIPLNPRNAS